MSYDFFWQTIEDISESIPQLNEKRKNALKTNDEHLILELSRALADIIATDSF